MSLYTTVETSAASDLIGGSIGSASSLAIGSAKRAFINGTTGDNDFFAVTLTAGHTYTFAMNGIGVGAIADPYLKLYDGSNTLLASDDDSGPLGGAKLTFTASATGTYYLAASGYSTSNGGYLISANEGSNPYIPEGTTQDVADYLTNGYWEVNNQQARHFGSNTISVNLSGLEPERQVLARLALDLWSDVANLTFVETTGSADITIDDTNSGAYSSSSTSGNTITSSLINVATSWYGGIDSVDSYTLQTFIHEIGHSLGLGHAGAYNGSATYGIDNVLANDTWQMSLMSYMAQNNYGGASYRFALTPMMADIMAIQSMYGAATDTRTGNTTYGFNSNAGDLYNFSLYSSAPAITIYDSGGTDTIDASGYSQNQLIDLRAGNFSNIGGLVGNVGIWTGTTVENAIGGSGSDTLYGNAAANTLTGNAGNDTIDAGAGNDVVLGGDGADFIYGGAGANTLTGGAGGDTFVLSLAGYNGGELSTITDFVNGTDFLRLDPATGAAANGGQAKANLVKVVDFGGNAMVYVDVDGTANGEHWQRSFQVNGYDQGDSFDVQWNYGGTDKSFTVAAPVSQLAGDFDGDGHSDLLYQRTTDGYIQVRLMDGTTEDTIGSSLSITSSVWVAEDAGDFNGDGKADVVYRNSSNGDVAVWLMDGTSDEFRGDVAFGLGTGYTLAAVGDFNGDGMSDMAMRDGTTGNLKIMLMNGTELLTEGATISGPGGWSIRGAEDFTGDGKDDLLWWDASGSNVGVWEMNGTVDQARGAAESVASGWEVRGAGDFNGDGKGDIVFQQQYSGQPAVWLGDGDISLNDYTRGSGMTYSAGNSWYVTDFGDYNGDGKDDLGWWNYASDLGAVWLMDGTTDLSRSNVIGPGNDWTMT